MYLTIKCSMPAGFFSSLSQVSGSPYAFFCYLVISLLWGFSFFRKGRLKRIAKAIQHLPEKDRKQILIQEYGIYLKEGLTAEEYIRARQQLYGFIVLITLVLFAAAIIIVSIVESENTHFKLATVTILVHSRNGQQDLPLRGRGQVVMHMLSEAKRASINENGQTFFPNINVGEKVKLDIDFSQRYRPLHPDSLYTIGQNQMIQIEIFLQGIGRVYGYVFYRGKPLYGVQVMIDTLRETTDTMGAFNIQIPESLQKEKYSVIFYKHGFESQIEPAFPETNEPLKVVLQKKK